MELRNKIAQILRDGVTYNHITDTVVIHGAIDELMNLFEPKKDDETKIKGGFNSMRQAVLKAQNEFYSPEERRMIETDILVERLQDATGKEEILKLVNDFVKNLEPVEEAWIPVAERKPEDYDVVLFWDSSLMGHMIQMGYFVPSQTSIHPKITHWQPLPKPPITKQEEK